MTSYYVVQINTLPNTPCEGGTPGRHEPTLCRNEPPKFFFIGTMGSYLIVPFVLVKERSVFKCDAQPGGEMQVATRRMKAH